MTSKEIIEREIVKLTTSIQLALGCVPAMNINIELCQQKLSELKQIKQDLDKLKQLEKENKELKEDLEESFDYNALRQLKINSLEEENTKLKKALDILKEYICISKRRNEVNGNYDISCIYSLGSYKDITKDEYELLKGELE